MKERVGGQFLEVELPTPPGASVPKPRSTGVGCGEPEPDERPDRLTLPAPGRPGTDRGRRGGAAPRRIRERHRAAGPDLGRRLPPADRRAPGRGRGRRRATTAALGRARERPRGRAPARDCPRSERWLREDITDACGGDRPQPSPFRARTGVAHLLDDPADHVRAAVRLRVRRRDRGVIPAGVSYVDFLLPGSSCSP